MVIVRVVDAIVRVEAALARWQRRKEWKQRKEGKGRKGKETGDQAQGRRAFEPTTVAKSASRCGRPHGQSNYLTVGAGTADRADPKAQNGPKHHKPVEPVATSNV